MRRRSREAPVTGMERRIPVGDMLQTRGGRRLDRSSTAGEPAGAERPLDIGKRVPIPERLSSLRAKPGLTINRGKARVVNLKVEKASLDFPEYDLMRNGESPGIRIERFLKRIAIAPDRIVRLTGDASLRAFYRVPYRTGSAVMMARDEFQPEENRTFVEARDHLAASGASVPEIYEYDEDNGVILMEDFGDLTLEERLRGADEETFERFYRAAIDELLAIQISGSILRRDSVAYGRAFDQKKLMKELDFFLLHTVEGFYKAHLGDGEREAIREGFSILAARLAALPRVLNHRDYHSRNLMVVGDALKIVDFQDARMGPCQYDLASLLRDSYVALDGTFRGRMVDYYLRESAERGISWHDGELFIERFDLMSLQRNLKACGTFGYMATARGNERYLKYLAPTFAYVKENAPGFDFMGECMRILGRHVSLLNTD